MILAGYRWHTNSAFMRKILWWIWCWTVGYTSDDWTRPATHCGDCVQKILRWIWRWTVGYTSDDWTRPATHCGDCMQKILWWIWHWTVGYTSDDWTRPATHCGDCVQTSQSKWYSFLQTSHFFSSPRIKEWQQLVKSITRGRPFCN